MRTKIKDQATNLYRFIKRKIYRQADTIYRHYLSWSIGADTGSRRRTIAIKIVREVEAGEVTEAVAMDKLLYLFKHYKKQYRSTLLLPFYGVNKEKLRLLDGNNCFYCQKEMNQITNHPDSATIEHLLPKSKGGQNYFDNYALSCRTCNMAKSATLTPQNGLFQQLESRLLNKGILAKSN